MSSPVRITGLVTFLAIIALVTAAIMLLLDVLIGQTIRTAGSELVGAKVELADADSSISEQKLTLTELSVTDPRAPMYNLFEVNKLVMDVDADALFWNKVVIDELSISDLQLNTRRETSGTYESRWLDSTEWNPMTSVAGFEQMTVENMPDPATVIAEEGLQTPIAIEQFKTELEQTKEALTTALDNLPDEEKVAEYKERFDAIKAQSKGGNRLLGLLGQGKEIKQLRDDIKADLNQIKTLKSQLSDAQTQITNDFNALKSMPAQDWQRLKAKYSLSGNGVNEIVSSLFGEQIGKWAQKGWHYYQLVSPYLNSYTPASTESEVKVSQQITDRGRKVLFEDQNPLPNYLIKQIALSSNIQAEGIAISGIIENLTTEPERWSEPLSLNLEGKSTLLELFTVVGTMDHRDPLNSQDVIEVIAQGISLSALPKQETNSELVINDGMVDVKANILRESNEIDATLFLTFDALNLASGADDAWQQQLVKAVNSLDKLSVTISMTGNITAPDVAIESSDLTAIGTAMIEELASEEIAEFETKLKNIITEQTAGQLTDLESLLDISAMQEKLDLTELNLNELLKISG